MALTALIDNTYFETHPLYIVESEYDSKLNENLILSVQEEIALKILGHVLYYDFNADWNGTSFDSQKWTDFVDGYTFQVSSKNVKWLGFKNLLKYFVYFEFQKYNQQQKSILGNIQANNENSEYSIDFTNEIKQYNKGIELLGIDWAFLFPSFKSDLCFDTDIEQIKPTAYNFIYNRITEFQNWNYYNMRKINCFGI